MLIGEKISKTFNQIQVLKNVDIKVENGKIVSIFGKSGAGKSTLLYILSSLDKPDKGEVLFDGTKISQLYGDQLSEFRNKKIGFVFQFHELIPELNILENVCLPGWIKKDNNVKEKALKLLQYFALDDFLDKKPLTLSGGEKQRVAIARSLINNPKIIFADEPTGNLDSKNSKILFDLFFKLRDDYNCSVVIVTHDEKNANICDRKLVIVDGKIKD